MTSFQFDVRPIFLTGAGRIPGSPGVLPATQVIKGQTHGLDGMDGMDGCWDFNFFLYIIFILLYLLYILSCL